jgi:hypothetical protein
VQRRKDALRRRRIDPATMPTKNGEIIAASAVVP